VAKLRELLGKAALVQDAVTAPEDANTRLAECSAVITDLCALIACINHTNATAKLPDGSTMVDAIAERNRLKQQIALIAEPTAPNERWFATVPE
jgi:hypothetical protein